jgi:hypothetical protein
MSIEGGLQFEKVEVQLIYQIEQEKHLVIIREPDTGS